MRKTLIIFVAFFGMVLSCSLNAAENQEKWVLGKYVVEGKVITPGRQALNVRSGPGTSFAPVGSLNYGTPVTVYQQQDGWFLISEPPKKEVVEDLAELLPVEPKVIEGEQWIIGQFVKNGTVDTGDGGKSVLNIRSGPSTTNDIVGALRHNEKVTVFDARDGWFRLSPSSAKPKWVMGDFVQYSKAGVVDTGSSDIKLTVLAAPDAKAEAVGALESGDEVTVSEVRDGWFCISKPAEKEVAEVAEEAPSLTINPKALMAGTSSILLLLLLGRTEEEEEEEEEGEEEEEETDEKGPLGPPGLSGRGPGAGYRPPSRF